MPFKVQTFRENIDSRLRGTAREELVRACEVYSRLTTARQKAGCIRGMMDVLDREVDEDTRRIIMAECGRRCIGASTLEKAHRLQREAQGLDDLLCRLNEAHIGGGHLKKEGNIIHTSYDRCYCGSVSMVRDPLSATYCYCSCGWYQQLFETLLDRPVKVELITSIIQGSERCQFVVEIQ